MESEREYGGTEHPSKDADTTLNKDETVGSAKYSSASSYLSSSSAVTHESSLQTTSPVHFPVIQVMERHGDLASDRIPASVFDSKPSTPRDWSVASNDSLFSIQIGNHSFSRDQFLMIGEDKFDELFKSGELRKSAELIRSRLPPLSSVGKQHNKNNLELGKKYEETGVDDKTLKLSPNENLDQLRRGVPQVEGSENSSSHQSDESGNSCQPLAFPKKKRSGWTLCPCSNHNWDFCLCALSSFWCKLPSWKSCFCTWSSCCCTWPSCGCKWPSCGCEWPSCGCKWPSCGCEWPSCGCEWPSCGCKWPSCGCEWPSCGCKWPSCGCEWPSCGCCRWPQSCCKFQCPSWPSFNCHCSSFSWLFCYPWNCRRKK